MAIIPHDILHGYLSDHVIASSGVVDTTAMGFATLTPPPGKTAYITGYILGCEESGVAVITGTIGGTLRFLLFKEIDISYSLIIPIPASAPDTPITVRIEAPDGKARSVVLQGFTV